MEERCAAECLLDKLIPAGQIRLQQHVGGGGRRGQQVGVQQRHLEGLAGTLLQILETLCNFGHTAVVQLVELTVGGWEVHEWMRRAPWQADKESKRWGREGIHHVQIGHLLCKLNCTEEKQEVSKCCGICLCPYLVVLIVAL